MILQVRDFLLFFLDGFEIIECEEGVRKVKVEKEEGVIGEGDGKDQDIAQELTNSGISSKKTQKVIKLFYIFSIQ